MQFWGYTKDGKNLQGQFAFGDAKPEAVGFGIDGSGLVRVDNMDDSRPMLAAMMRGSRMRVVVVLGKDDVRSGDVSLTGFTAALKDMTAQLNAYVPEHIVAGRGEVVL